MVFWVNTLLSDFNLDSYTKGMTSSNDATMLGNFAYTGLREFDGTAKPALALWDGFRTSSP